MRCVFVLTGLLTTLAAAQNHDASRMLPGIPANVVAVALRDAAVVAWVVPEMAGDTPPITSYTITALDGDASLRPAATMKAHAPGAVLRGLSSRHCYMFSVHANNTAGRGPESERSEMVCPLPPPGADIELAMTAPASAGASSELTFTLTVTNNGVADAPLVNIIDALPAPLASFTTSQGVCQGVVGGASFGCNLGTLYAGASATVTVTVQAGNTEITNTAWATAYDASGKTLEDPVPVNNTATATVRLQ